MELSIVNDTIKLNREKVIDFLRALLLFLPTIVFVPHTLYLAGLIFIIPVLTEENLFKLKSLRVDKNLAIIFLIVFLSFLNRLLHLNKLDNLGELIPYFFLLPLTYLLARQANRSTLHFILLFILIECGFVFYEYALHINSIFSSINKFSISGGETLLYDRRAFGLSDNSSSMASKLVIGFLIIDYIKLNRAFAIIARALLFVALIMTFNRTALGVVFIYGAFQMASVYKEFFFDLLKLKSTYWRLVIIGISFLAIITATALAFINAGEILEQLTRGKGTIDFSGREIIWPRFFDFIKENLWLGNGSFKYYVPYGNHFDTSGNVVMAHAHNSFLELVASNGLIISLFYFALIILNTNKKNRPYIIAFIIFSITQYEIFWGISLSDVVFFAFLFNSVPDKRNP